MRPRGFDVESFYAALESQRLSRGQTWRQVAQESGVSASTLTRMGQGKRPDIDTMAALLHWSGLRADMFIHRDSRAPTQADPLACLTSCLRADTNLSREAVSALEAVVQATYARLRHSNGPALYWALPEEET